MIVTHDEFWDQVNTEIAVRVMAGKRRAEIEDLREELVDAKEEMHAAEARYEINLIAHEPNATGATFHRAHQSLQELIYAQAHVLDLQNQLMMLDED